MNRLGFIAALVAAVPGAAGAGSTPAASLCVTNASPERYHFTVRAIGPATRIGRDLAPGQTLCLEYPGRGVVAAFETAESLEGCSRLVPSGARETLVDFGRFDRCAWSGD